MTTAPRRTSKTRGTVLGVSDLDRPDAALDTALLLQFILAVLPLIDGGDRLTAQQAADLAGVDAKTIKLWATSHGIGRYDGDARRYRISRSRLRAFLLEHHGCLPARFDSVEFPL